VTVDDGQRALAEFAPLFVVQLVARLPRALARGEDFLLPLLLLFDGRLFHLRKILHRKWPVAKPALLDRAWHGVCVHFMWWKD
jgi:hypothetical protein